MQSSAAQNLSDPTPKTLFYTWNGYRCAYERYSSRGKNGESALPLVLIPPVGVGLWRKFWQRFCTQWQTLEGNYPIYNPDLLGCGESDKPHIAYTPRDWGEQLQHFLATVVQQSAVIVVQGASLPIALRMVEMDRQPAIRGLILAGPPTWELVTQPTDPWKHRLTWNFLDSPLGRALYRYTRRRSFLRSFSERQLFATPEAVDSEWLDMLELGATDTANRYAVFSFLAGFWRQDYAQIITSISQPTLVVVGTQASSISRKGSAQTPQQRLSTYGDRIPNSQGTLISGRNVLPYESTEEFVRVAAEFVHNL